MSAPLYFDPTFFNETKYYCSKFPIHGESTSGCDEIWIFVETLHHPSLDFLVDTPFGTKYFQNEKPCSTMIPFFSSSSLSLFILKLSNTIVKKVSLKGDDSSSSSCRVKNVMLMGHNILRVGSGGAQMKEIDHLFKIASSRENN